MLANRLSADPRNRVLLLEAGGRDRSPWIHMPGGFYKLVYHPTLSWNFTTEPEPGMNGRSLIWPRGRVLGGSSSINAMVYIRGQPQDFDMWRQRGCVGWSWSDVLPYFRRAEDQARGSDDFHGAGGPLGVSDIRDNHPLSDAFIEAATEWGLPRNDDFNGPEQEGIGYFQLTVRNTRRCSTAVGYLRPARAAAEPDRHHRCLREPGRARGAPGRGRRRPDRPAPGAGVPRRPGDHPRGRRHQVAASAPALGHRARRSAPELGIPVLHDLPGVGQDLQDHLQTKLVYRVEGVRSLNELRRNPLRMAREGARFALFRRGPLASGPSMAGGFARTDPALDLPDMQLHFNPLSGDRPAHFHDFPGCSPIVSQLRPESRGELRLRSPNPRDQPAMRANYLATETDRRVNIRTVRIGREIMSQPAMQRFKATEVAPGPQAQSDDEILGFVREAGYTQYHPTCSCRMGVDDRAVVDPQLRVQGIMGLRVVDASIMPAVVSGNTNATSIMIGEKAADLILARPTAAEAA